MIISLCSSFINTTVTQFSKNLKIKISKYINASSLPVTHCIRKLARNQSAAQGKEMW